MCCKYETIVQFVCNCWYMVCTHVIHRLYMMAGSCKGVKPGIRLKGEDKGMAVTRGACHTKLRVQTWGENRCRSHRPEGGGMGVTTGADHTDLRVEAWGCQRVQIIQT
jgi:hypothetical protein